MCQTPWFSDTFVFQTLLGYETFLVYQITEVCRIPRGFFISRFVGYPGLLDTFIYTDILMHQPSWCIRHHDVSATLAYWSPQFIKYIWSVRHQGILDTLLCQTPCFRDQWVVCWACCPAWCSITGSTLLSASSRGDFSLGVDMGSDSIPWKLFQMRI